MKMKAELSDYSDGINDLKIRFLKEYLKPGNCVDIGCGNGLYGYTILEKCSELLQIDIIDRRLAEASHFPFLAMDANHLDLPVSKITNIVAFDIMEHLEDDIKFCQTVKRRLTIGGRFIISVPNKDDTQPRIMGLTYMHHIDKTHRREYLNKDLIFLLENNGFNVLEIRPHFNQGIPNAGKALAKPNLLSRVVAKLIFMQIQFMLWIGLFENRCTADWFCVAEAK